MRLTKLLTDGQHTVPLPGFRLSIVDARITHCSVCWGYRERALAIAAALREKYGATVEVVKGPLGGFNVQVDDKMVFSRGGGIAARIKSPRLPDVGEVISTVERLRVGTNSSDCLRQHRSRHEFDSADAKRFYDRFGSKQDAQIYERVPIERLIAYSDFEHASAVLELGCGTGRLAQCLLGKYLSPDASYRGIDISTTMIGIATERLSQWSGRASVFQADVASGLPYAVATFDRFIATYVLDLLPAESIQIILGEAHRVLRPGGKLCGVVSTEGVNAISRVVCSLWKKLYAYNPSLVGGCRPLQLSSLLDAQDWQINCRQVITSWGISSEILVATPV